MLSSESVVKELRVKNVLRLLLVLLYIGVMGICAALVIKPGAAIFYNKLTIPGQSMVADAGFAYRYRLDKNPFVFQLNKALLRENGQLLTASNPNIVASQGYGTYSVDKSAEGIYYLYFSSSDNTNPVRNNREYLLFIPISFASRLMGIIYLVILLPGIAWFLIFALRSSVHRQTIHQHPLGILNVIGLFFTETDGIIQRYMNATWKLIKAEAVFWKQLFPITILAAYLYIFMEWIFFATMPSFMSVINLPNKVEILLLSGLAFSLACIFAVIAFTLLDIIGAFFRIQRITRFIGAIIPAAILAILALLLLDNFTYTLFKFGISTSAGIIRAIYLFFFILLFAAIYLKVLDLLGLMRRKPPEYRSFNRLSYLALGILVISLGLGIVRLDVNKLTTSGSKPQAGSANARPNILLIGSDGVNAENMSVYGYARNTTPRIMELAQDSLVADNAFTNSGNSPASVVSIFTSKLPTTTRVGFSPDILTGVDAYQHLPGILKSDGYRTVEFGVPLYVDSYALNVQNGFDMVNNHSSDTNLLGSFMQNLGFDNPAYFINRLSERLSDRIKHIFYIQQMQNPYELVTKPAASISDQEKIDLALDQIDQAQQPIFIHLHLLGTHGDYFELPFQNFSRGEQQDKPWMTDFYDDAISVFDSYVGQVIDHLKANGQFDNTILIIYTDHAQNWQVNERIPLIVHFPGNSYAGRIDQNVQNLDIAPTVLDYLGWPKPVWMEGKSILSANLEGNRIIFGTYVANQTYNENQVWLTDPNFTRPPFYQFTYITAINCQKWYMLDLKQRKWTDGDISGYVAPCNTTSLSSFADIKQATLDQLASDGFDISSLR